MSKAISSQRRIAIIRWIARIWTLPIFAFAIMRILTPDPSITQPVPVVDWFLLSLWGVAIIGLLIAWRWETVGSIITIASMMFRELAWVVLRGPWIVNFLIIWAALVPPALLFLVAKRIEISSTQETNAAAT
jgi:hypothetical protein